MKRKIKKAILPLAALGICMNAYAADGDDYSEYYDDNIADEATEAMTVPADYQGVRASISYLLGQPTYNGGFINLNEERDVVFGRIRPAFTQSGLAADVAYDFSNGKFVQADWMQFFGNTQSQNGNRAEIDLEPNPGATGQITGSTRSTFLRIGGDVGQTLNIGDNLLYRLSFGVQYARIGISEQTSVNDLMLNDESIAFQPPEFNRKSVFNGIGPRIGLGAEYDIGWNVKLVGHTSASLNVGNIKATTATSTQNLDEDELTKTTSSDSLRTIVPGLEGNLGVRYDYDLGRDNGVLSTEIGYQAIGYFNSFSGTRDAANSIDVTSINSPSSYGNQAVYLKLGYNGGLVS